MTPAQLGAVADDDGVSFAVFSSLAEAVELCLFDDGGAETRRPLDLDEGYVWRGRVDGLGSATRYGYRVHGAYDPSSGARCNPAKLLLDPYARAISGTVDWHDARSTAPARWTPRPTSPARSSGAATSTGRASAARTPRSSTRSSTSCTPRAIRCATRRFPRELRGTFRGLAHPAVTEHLVGLGVTAVELLPVHQFVHDRFLVARGLGNYWGYQSIGYFAPHNEYALS